jgi:hypothetical protein
MSALWSWVTRRRESKVTVSQDVALADILSRYDVVEVVPTGPDHEPYILVSDPVSAGPRLPVQFAGEPESMQFAEPTSQDLAELGSTSASPWTAQLRDEYKAELRDLRGLQQYDRMRRSDGTVRGTLRQLKTPVLGARWFIEPASNSEQDKRIAEYVHRCLYDYMSISFTQVLTEALMMAEFGYFMFEKVYDIRMINGQPRVVWRKLAPRHPMDVKQWHYDSKGGPSYVEMYGPNGSIDDVKIPIEKLLVFTFDREANNMIGISVLRSAYKHWYYKEQLYKIDAIQKERHGIGIPVIHLPPGFSNGDRKAANELGRNLRTNERAHVVLPPNWDLIFAKIEGQPVDAMVSIEHHDAKIRSNILADYLERAGTTNADIGHDLFLKATRFIADIICDDFNLYAIPQLVDFNYARLPNGYPKLRARRIGETEDQRTLSFTIRNMVGAGVIEPDDVLEAFVRKELDLPLKDVSTARQIVVDHNDDVEEAPVDSAQKQRGQQAGLPRQQSRPPVGPPRSNAGTDRSGGK